MTQEQLFKLVVETSSELEAAKYDLVNTVAPRISYADIEDLSDAYQSRLEYNWWVDEQKELIQMLENQLASYKSQLGEMAKRSYFTLNGDMAQEFNDSQQDYSNNE